MNFFRYTFTVGLLLILASTFVVAIMLATGLYLVGLTTYALLLFGVWLLFFIACLIGNYIRWKRFKSMMRTGRDSIQYSNYFEDDEPAQ